MRTQATTAPAPPRGAEPMRSLLPLVLSLVILAAAVAGVALRGTEPVEPVLLRHSFLEGDTRTYDLAMRNRVSPQGLPTGGDFGFSGTATMTRRVAEVNPDGTAVVEITVSELRMEDKPTADLAPWEGETMRTHVGADGRVLSIEGFPQVFGMTGVGGFPAPEGANPAESSTSQLFFPRYPPEAVGPGDTWEDSHEMALPFGEQTVTVSVAGRHEGFEDTRFGRAARIIQQIEMPMSMELSMQDMFGQMQGMVPGGPAPQMPPGMEGASLSVQGESVMLTSNLVGVEDGDIVESEGTTTISMTVEMHGVPGGGLFGGEGMGTQMSMEMRLVRTS